jgi:hypothetical protein
MCYGCQNSGGVFSQSQRLRERGTTYYFELDSVVYAQRI